MSTFRLASEGYVDAADATKQPLDTDLTAIAALTSAADKVPYATGSGTWALASFTSAGRALVDDANAAAQRTTLGLATVASSGAYADLSGTPTQVYLKDSATPAHYWKLTVSTLGVLGTTDAGTSVPTDGVIGNQ